MFCFLSSLGKLHFPESIALCMEVMWLCCGQCNARERKWCPSARSAPLSHLCSCHCAFGFQVFHMPWVQIAQWQPASNSLCVNVSKRYLCDSWLLEQPSGVNGSESYMGTKSLIYLLCSRHLQYISSALHKGRNPHMVILRDFCLAVELLVGRILFFFPMIVQHPRMSVQELIKSLHPVNSH